MCAVKRLFRGAGSPQARSSLGLTFGGAEAPDDFFKIWLHVEGPERILKWVQEHSPEIRGPRMTVQPCQSCLFLYRSKKARQVISKHYRTEVPRVLPLFMAALAAQAIRESVAPRGVLDFFEHKG